MENKTVDTKKTGPVLSIILKIVLSAVLVGAVFVVGTAASLYLMSEDIHLVLTYIVGYLLPAIFLPLIWLKKKKKYLKIALILAVLCLVVLAGNFGFLKYDASLRVDTSCHADEQGYLPFREDSAALNVKSETFHLTEDFPLIDGSEATLPLYTAFINSVYPETDTPYGDYMLCNGEYGYEYLTEGESDVFIELYYSEDHKVQAKAAGDFEYTDIASDAFVFFVHKDNPVDSLTIEQLKGIYSGQITNWAELGGKNKQIKAYQNEADTISQDMMEIFMGETVLMEAPGEMGYSHLYAWEEQVSGYRNKADAIGFTFRHAVANNPDVKMLAVDSVAPTGENVSNGSYPLAFPVVAVTGEDSSNENLDMLLGWILSEEGQRIAGQAGYAGVLAK